MNTFLTYIYPIITSLLTAIIVAGVAFKQFRKEKHWEQKKELYFNIINTLTCIQKFYEKIYRDHYDVENYLDYNPLEKYDYKSNDNHISELNNLLSLCMLLSNKKIYSPFKQFIKNLDKKDFDFLLYNSAQDYQTIVYTYNEWGVFIKQHKEKLINLMRKDLGIK